ncbi:MAG: hypothetical protein U0903_03655 [Planctomycetales bacterium]
MCRELDCLESRVLPATVSIISTPAASSTGVGKISSTKGADEGLPYWTQDAFVNLPENSPLPTYKSGSFQSSGDVVMKVVGEKGEVAGDPVKVSLDIYSSGWWADDPQGPEGNNITLKVGYQTPNDIYSDSRGHAGGDPNWGTAYHFQDLVTRDIETTVGATLTFHVVHSGYSNPFLDYYPTNDFKGGYGDYIESHLSFVVTDVEYLVEELQVLTFDDDIKDPNIFGPYLGGVQFPVNFDTVDPFVGTDPIKTVKWTLDGTTRTADSNFDFTYNVGGLTAGDHALRVTAYDANNKVVGRSPEMKIRVIKQLDFELQAEEKPGTLVNDTDSRFFNGTKAEVKFVGTVKAFPTYYRDTFDVPAWIRIGTTTYDITNLSKSTDADYKFTFDADVGALPVGSASVDFVVHGILETAFGDQPEHLEVVKAPTWLASGKPVFDSATGQYKWTDVNLGQIKVDAPQISSGQSWLDDTFKKGKKKGLTKSGASVAAFVSVQAPISIKEKPTYNNGRLEAQASLMGKTILPLTTYGTGAVNIGGTLDPKTLDPTGFGVQLTQPIQVAQFQLTDSHKVKVDLLDKVVPGFEWLLDVSAIGQVGPTVGTVRINAGIGLTKQGDQVVFDSSKTFVGLANSTIEGSGSVGLKVQVLKGYVLDAEAVVSFKPKITVNLDAHFKGAVGSPEFSNVIFVVAGELGYNAWVSADSKLNPGKPQKWESGEKTLGPYKLVDYHG